MIRSFLVEQVKDPISRENFEKLNTLLKGTPILQAGLQPFDIDFSAAVTNIKIPHNLGIVPLDIIQTLKTGAGTITYNYNSFTSEFLDITTSAACRVRFLAGHLGQLEQINA